MVNIITLESEKDYNMNPYFQKNRTEAIKISNEEWQKVLPELLFHVAREKSTERPFIGTYTDTLENGTYYCACCGNKIFHGSSKFLSSCGWPSFTEAFNSDAVYYIKDYSYNMERVEVLCTKCDAHLGHVFDDGPAPNHLRYCINSISMVFEPE